MLSPDQFASVRCGDFYCTSCKDPNSPDKHKYFWKRELSVLPGDGVLRTVDDWRAFFKGLPGDTRIYVDMNRTTGGSFEYVKVTEVNHETRMVTSITTKHGE